MKIISFFGGSNPWSAARQLVQLAAVLTATLLSAAETKPAGPAEPKTHALFMGADIFVEYQKTFYRVQDVIGGSFVIKVEGKEVKVAADFRAIKLKVDRSLKLTGTAVSVAHFKAERAYTAVNDPTKQFMNSQSVALAGQDAAAAALAKQDAAQLMTNLGARGAAGSPRPDERGFGGQDMNQLEVNFSRAASDNLADQGRGTSLIGHMQDDLTAGQFDAMDVSFEVSSDKPIRKPYVVVMVQYAVQDSKPGETLNWIYAAPLEPLGTEIRRFNIRKGGFPPGFILEKSQVHVYDAGQELASNIADKQVPLTRTEAFTYLLLDYVVSHKTATLPAKPIMGKLSTAARAQLTEEQFDRSYYVKVSKDGLPLATYLDTNCSLQADETVATAVSNIRFYPALENGKTVEGVAELKFGRLAF